MESGLNTTDLTDIEKKALAMLGDPAVSRSLRAAVKSFIPRCARLRAALVVMESDQAIINASDK